ncbi:hypothetical protein BDK51DRAFT_28288 [Blyttiomyces helicus]|uniref:Uncharacterized protein n=1 Tax=Blyttiomyces helicus TaxID=388810 RepID=A0A4P9WI81_9FUNG|nr:hypothetical protein BDK51DRAFT_28288 [Blyttiomyces helicus]|eukprot:RKO92474.1 hypothetical protein BDK51DRAFT_28288 [Blyttiomyces helicus]
MTEGKGQEVQRSSGWWGRGDYGGLAYQGSALHEDLLNLAYVEAALLVHSQGSASQAVDLDSSFGLGSHDDHVMDAELLQDQGKNESPSNTEGCNNSICTGGPFHIASEENALDKGGVLPEAADLGKNLLVSASHAGEEYLLQVQIEALSTGILAPYVNVDFEEVDNAFPDAQELDKLVHENSLQVTTIGGCTLLLDRADVGLHHNGPGVSFHRLTDGLSVTHPLLPYCPPKVQSNLPPSVLFGSPGDLLKYIAPVTFQESAEGVELEELTSVKVAIAGAVTGAAYGSDLGALRHCLGEVKCHEPSPKGVVGLEWRRVL